MDSEQITQVTASNTIGGIDLFKQSINTYKKNFSLLTRIALVQALITLILSISLAGKSATNQIYTASYEAGGALLSTVTVVSISILTIVVQVAGQIALLMAVAGQTQSVSGSYKQAIKKIIPFWWISFLISMIGLGGFILFVIPGIIFSIWFSLSIFVFINEGERGMNALLKSRFYTHNNKVEMLTKLMPLLLLIIPVVIVDAILKKLLGTNAEIISTAFIVLFVTPIAYIYLQKIYTIFKDRKSTEQFVSTRKQKVLLTLVTLLGLAIIPLTAFSAFYALSKVYSSASKNNTNLYQQTTMMQIQLALESYRAENTKYPSTIEEISPEYLQNIPTNPETGEAYYYYASNDLLAYKLCDSVEKNICLPR